MDLLAAWDGGDDAQQSRLLAVLFDRSGSLGGDGPDPAATPIQQVPESMIPNPDDDSSS